MKAKSEEESVETMESEEGGKKGGLFSFIASEFDDVEISVLNQDRPKEISKFVLVPIGLEKVSWHLSLLHFSIQTLGYSFSLWQFLSALTTFCSFSPYFL